MALNHQLYIDGAFVDAADRRIFIDKLWTRKKRTWYDTVVPGN